MANDKNVDTSSESSETSCETGCRSGSSSPGSSALQPAPQTPEQYEIGSNGKPVPTIKLQRKCASHWTCSSASKLRRGRVKLKLKPISTDAAPAKEESLTSLRIATDLPRFNWLELKLSQQTSPSASDSHPNDRCERLSPTTTLGPTKSVEMIPLKRRRLECAQSSQPAQLTTTAVRLHAEDNVHHECRLPLKKRTDLTLSSARDNRDVSTALKSEDAPVEPSSDSVSPMTTASKWPLKKRIFNPASQDESEPSSPVRNSTEEANRGPVICKNLILPPTPPSSSAPTEGSTESSDEVQEEPLDLSKAVLSIETGSKSKPVSSSTDEPTNEVQIISVTKHTPSGPAAVHKEIPRRPELIPARPIATPPQMFALNRIQSGIFSAGHGAFKAVQKTTPTPAAIISDHSLGRKEDRIHMSHVTIDSAKDHRRAILPKENPSMTVRPVVPVVTHAPFIHPPVQMAQWNQIHYRTMPHQLSRSHNDTGRPLVRPFALPSTRVPPVRYPPVSRMDEAWNNSPSAGLSRIKTSGNSQPEVELLSPSSSFAVPRFFRPKDVLSPATFPKKINNQPSTSISATPPTRPPIAAFNPAVSSPNWPPSSFRCNVCLEAAGFKCAGCHLYAYCSTDCQAKDWPLHSRMCRVSS